MQQMATIILMLTTMACHCVAATSTIIGSVQGAVKVEIAIVYSSVSLSTVALSSTVANPSGVTSSVATVAGIGVSASSLLTSTKSYYLEVTTKGLNATGFVGELFEVDVAAPLVGNGAQIVLNLSTPTNTRATVPDLSDYSIVVRDHVTLSRVLLKDSGSASTRDQVNVCSCFDS